ncbi:MAG: hypothetical protein ACLFQJ_09405, partial [Campylobacterales bacterium]
MKKAEIKQQILESQKSGDGGGFTESTLAYLPLIDSKSELDEFVNYFSNRAVFELLESKATDSIKK